MYQWQRLLHDGNECFDQNNWLQAEYYYKEAASYLDLLWSADIKNVELLMAWICVSHNLATLFEVQGDTKISLQYLLIPHQRMVELSQISQPCEDLRDIAFNALKTTFMPILLFTKKYPTCTNCQESLREFQTKIESSQAIIH